MREVRVLQLMLLPFGIGAIALVFIPAVVTIVLALTRFNPIGSPEWVGFQNFVDLTQTELVRLSLFNSLFFVGLAVPLRVLGGLGLALLYRKRRRGVHLYRAAVLVPTLVPQAAYALIWLWILNPVYGPLNLILGGLGLPTFNWLSDPYPARVGMVLLSVFQLGEGMIILLAGLQTISQDVLDAAAIDGATRWGTFRKILLPLLLPWLFLLTARDILISLQNTFVPSFMITYGGPYYSTTFLPLQIYEMAFDYLQFGRVAALLVLVMVIFGLVVYALIDRDWAEEVAG